jgi:hypothetical protein
MSRQRKRKRTSTTPAWRRWVPGLAAAAGGLIITAAVLLARSGDRAAASPDDGGAPRVAVNQEVFDYGMVKVDTPIETVFRVSNVGGAALKIVGNPQIELVEGC